MSALDLPPRIPLSPSSPPETGLKRRRISESTPKSPLSPPLMSVATKSYVSSYGNPQHPEEMASRSSQSPAPSSSSYTQPTSQRVSQGYSTPRSTVSAIPGSSTAEDGDQHRDKRQRVDETDKADNSATSDQHTLPTNHERHTDVKMEGIEDDNVQQATTIKVDDFSSSTNVSLEQVQEDMGDAFLLCRSKVPRQRPNPSNHLLAIYGLSPLLRSVARNDPLTGEKINKLRKSYEGQIKSFQLAGVNKPVKGDRNVEEDQPGPLRRVAGSSVWGLVSDEQWNAENAKVKTEVTPEYRLKLRKAVQMQPGKVRDVEKWDNVLGHERPRVVVPLPATVQSTTAPPTVHRVPNGVPRSHGVSVADAKRQTRGKKRSYGDDSFVGYGEGYSDPEEAGDPEGDYGDEEGDRRRRRKKDSFNGPLTYGQMMGR